MKELLRRYPVLTFVLLTLGFQFAVVGFVGWHLPDGARIHDDAQAHMIFRLRVFGPLLFAVALTAWFEGRAGLRNLFGSFFKWRVGAQWYALAFGWKFLFTYLGIGAIWLLGIKGWPGWAAGDGPGGLVHSLGNLARNMPFIVGIAFVEETAWMKYCVTRMQERFSAFRSCLLVGISWGLWYLPMLLVGEGVPDGYPWPVFLLSMSALAILLGWTYNMTHSGTVLLIMQIVSNCAFFLIPVLPDWHAGDPTFVTGFVVVNFISAVTLVLVFGWRDLGTKPRARWSDGMPAKSSPARSPTHMVQVAAEA